MNLSRFVVVILLPLGIILPSRAATTDRDAEILFRHARTTLDADSAATLYFQMVEMFPRDTLSAWALLRLAQYASARGELAQVEERVSRLREMFPRSAARAEAAVLLPERREEPLTPPKQAPPHVVARPVPPAPVPSTPAPTPAPTTKPTLVLAVQLGAFAVKANAVRMQTLVGSKYRADIVERARSSGPLYVVLAGTFSTQADAESAVASLEQETGIRGVIVKR